MNRLFFVIAFAFTVGLSSCNKELDQIPTPANARAGAANVLPPVVVAQKRYQLVKRGEDILTYEFPFNRLSKVTSTNQYGGTTSYEYNDTPGNKSVRASRYLSSRLMNTDIFQLDDNGLCVRADYWSFIYDSDHTKTQPTDIQVVHRQYEYLNGRISYVMTTSETASYGESLKPFGQPRTDSYLYNTNGDLTIIQSFVNQKKTTELLFGYGSSVNQPDAEDKLPLNPIYATRDPYLPVFGSFNKHLVRLELKKQFDGFTPPPGGYKTTYDYVLNKEGYVTSRDLKRWDNFTLTQAYEYSPVLTFPF